MTDFLADPDYARTYDEDDMVTARKGDLRAVLDVATQSMDFGSGFLDNEQVEALRKLAGIIGIDPLLVTPANFVCQYTGQHRWSKRWRTSRPIYTLPDSTDSDARVKKLRELVKTEEQRDLAAEDVYWSCVLCHHQSDTEPEER